MTTTVRYIEGVTEFESRWMDIWPLLDSLDQFHADLHQKELRPGREEWTYDYFRSLLQAGDFWFEVAEQDGEIVGIGTATILPKGDTHPGPIGSISNVFLRESVRGQGLYWRIFETLMETLRQQGLTLWEAMNYAFNTRIFEVHGSETWGCSLRRQPRDTVPEPPMPLRRVKNLDEEWAGIWRLLQPSASGTETEARTRAEAILKKRGAMFVAGQEPVGVIIGRLFVNEGIFVERVGKVTDLEIEDGANQELSQALLGRLEQWLISKRATEIGPHLLRHGEYEAWNEFGFQPYFPLAPRAHPRVIFPAMFADKCSGV